MLKRITLLMGAVLVAAPFAFAQTAATQDFPLETLRIRGSRTFSAERIITATGLKIGAPVNRAGFNAARDRLLATGAFESVGFEFKGSAANSGYDAVFTVVETEPLFKYRFETLPSTDAAMRSALRLQEPIFDDAIPPTPQVMNRYSSALAKFLIANGNPGAQVIGEINSDTGEAMVVFKPLGQRLNISEVNFTGNTLFTNQELWRKINPVAVGVVYSEPLFQRMLDSSIRAAYEEKGRLRVAFPKVETKRSEDNDGIDVFVAIEEGAVYTLAGVDYRGVSQSLRPELNKLAAWRLDETADFSLVDQSLVRFRKHFREDGYLHAATSVDRSIDDAKRTVQLTITITPGARFAMGKLDIKGLDINSEPVIRKMWKMNQGDPYKEGYPDGFLMMIQNEGYFDNLARTSLQADVNEKTQTVDVTLTFLGAKAAAALDKAAGKK